MCIGYIQLKKEGAFMKIDSTHMNPIIFKPTEALKDDYDLDVDISINPKDLSTQLTQSELVTCGCRSNSCCSCATCNRHCE